MDKIKKYGITIGIFLCSIVLHSIVLNYRMPDILVQLIMYMAIVGIFLLITKSAKKSFIIVNILEGLFTIACYLKVEIRFQPLEPWDIFFVSNVRDFLNFGILNLEMIARILLYLIFSIAITFAQITMFDKYCEIPKLKSKRFLFLLGICCFILIFAITSYKKVLMKYIFASKNGYSNYGPTSVTAKYGALNLFLFDIGIMDIGKAPNGYSEEKIQHIYEKYATYEIDDISAKEYDNVIMILMESFIDVTKLPGVHFTKDPLANFHRYSNEKNTGKMSVTNIGGGTSNVEYQALTMFSIDQYPTGIYPYMHCIQRELNVLPRIMKENGYTTTGIHSFNKGFYSRNRAYPLLGIDTFITDEDFVNPIYYDIFIKDTEITKQVKALLNENKKNFITISTMGTHPPYNYFMFDEYDEWITVEGLNEEYTLVFNNYIQKLRVLDQMFGEMVKCIQESGTNTLLVAYGDHYPHMYQIIESIGLIRKNDKNITPQEYPNLFETPYIIYSTCDENISVREKMTPNSLGIYILENVKLENIPWFYQVIYEYCLNHKSVEDYHMVQYDEMFGKKYWRNMNGEGE